MLVSLEILLILIFGLISLVTLILGVKNIRIKRKPCADCNNSFNNQKICPNCGNPNPYKIYKPILLFGTCIISLIVAGICFIPLSSRMFNVSIESSSNNSNERDPSLAQIEVIAEYINIRESKDINSPILGKVYQGEIYTILEEDNNSSYHWYKINTNNGITGYIAGKYNNEDYVKKLETSINNGNNQPVINKTPKERFKDVLLNRGFTTLDGNKYSLYYSGYNSGYTMYFEIDLNKGVYSDFNSSGSLAILEQYFYKEQKAVYTYKYGSYWGTITWNLKTSRWNCDSSINNWCKQYGEEYVNKYLNETIKEFNEYLTKANVTLNDIK